MRWRRGSRRQQVDVVVVGAGFAGLAAAAIGAPAYRRQKANHERQLAAEAAAAAEIPAGQPTAK